MRALPAGRRGGEMRIAGLIPNVGAEVRAFQHQDVVRECEARREAWKYRFSPPESACPYGCDGSGWRLVEDDEDQTPRSLEVKYDGRLYTPCECNMKDNRTVRRPFVAQ